MAKLDILGITLLLFAVVVNIIGLVLWIVGFPVGDQLDYKSSLNPFAGVGVSRFYYIYIIILTTLIPLFGIAYLFIPNGIFKRFVAIVNITHVFCNIVVAGFAFNETLISNTLCAGASTSECHGIRVSLAGLVLLLVSQFLIAAYHSTYDRQEEEINEFTFTRNAQLNSFNK